MSMQRHLNSVTSIYLYFVSIYWVGFVSVEEVFCEVTFRHHTGSMAAIHFDKCHMDTIWCVGIGGCFILHVVY